MKYLTIRLGKDIRSNVGGYFYERKEVQIPVFSNEFERLLNSGYQITSCSVEPEMGCTNWKTTDDCEHATYAEKKCSKNTLELKNSTEDILE